ncbi:hypothetical protein TYRP_002989 [Tyrophagus putrescentiae]|nr:hypothetical protein TYRP_002989 [Tyrophagus putrescentiae]
MTVIPRHLEDLCAPQGPLCTSRTSVHLKDLHHRTVSNITACDRDLDEVIVKVTIRRRKAKRPQRPLN